MNPICQTAANETQCRCVASFTEIHPRFARSQRGYGQSADWRAPVDAYIVFGRIVFSTLAYHPRSVIAWSVPNIGTAWKRILSLKLSERLSHASLKPQGALFLLCPAFFFFFVTLFSSVHADNDKGYETRYCMKINKLSLAKNGAKP